MRSAVWAYIRCMRMVLVLLVGVAAFGQQPPEPLQAPWVGVPEGFRSLPIGKLNVPGSLKQWTGQRSKVKAVVVNSLGEMPRRPSPAAVKVVSVDKRDGW